jgi:hypothetical protein
MSVTALRRQGVIDVIGDTRWPADWPRPNGGTTSYHPDWNKDPFE